MCTFWDNARIVRFLNHSMDEQIDHTVAPTELFCSGKKTLERNTARIEICMHRSTIHIVYRGMIPRYGRYVYMGICLPICLFHIEWLLTLSNDVSGKIWYWLIDKNLAQKIKNRIKQSFINSRPWYRVSSFVNILFYRFRSWTEWTQLRISMNFGPTRVLQSWETVLQIVWYWSFGPLRGC